MVAARQNRALPLPKGWPRRLRSAVIQAISLAQFSLTAARGLAANSWNARIRLKQENDRLRQEIALFTEEMRIKDARMERIPAQRRPHYPPAGDPRAPCRACLVAVPNCRASPRHPGHGRILDEPAR